MSPIHWIYGGIARLKPGEKIDKIIEMLSPDYISGLTLLGGEPFELANQLGVLPLVRKVKEIYPSKKIWAYSGY